MKIFTAMFFPLNWAGFTAWPLTFPDPRANPVTKDTSPDGLEAVMAANLIVCGTGGAVIAEE